MTYFRQFITITTLNAPEVVTAIKSGLTASGWTDTGGGAYTKTYDSTPLNITISATELDSVGRLAVVMNGNTFYLSAGRQLQVGFTACVEFSAFEDFAFIKLTGPGPGSGGDATYGSPASSVLLTRYVPYSSDNSDKQYHWAAFGMTTAPSAWTVSSIASGWNVYRGVAGFPVTSQIIELATLRPAVQDDTSVGDLLPSRNFGNGIVYAPYLIVSTSSVGLIGRLRNVFFGSEAYALAGDVTTHSDATVYVNGVPYITVTPHAYPTTGASSAYSPFGKANVNSTSGYGASGSVYYLTPGSSGPYIIVRGGIL